MATYVAYLPPEEWNCDPRDEFQLVRDGKSPLALIFPPFWLAWHRLWLALLVYATVALAIILLAVWQPGAPVMYLSAVPGLYLLLEGDELIRRNLERLGWQYAGVYEGDNREEAEIRFLENADPSVFSSPKAGVSKPNEVRKLSPAPAATAGLFPE